MCLPLAKFRGEQLKESPCSTMAVSFRFLVLHPTMVMVMVEMGPSTWYLAGGGGWGRGTLACRLGRWGRRGRRRRRGKRVEDGSHVLWVEEHLGNRGVGGGEV